MGSGGVTGRALALRIVGGGLSELRPMTEVSPMHLLGSHDVVKEGLIIGGHN